MYYKLFESRLWFWCLCLAADICPCLSLPQSFKSTLGAMMDVSLLKDPVFMLISISNFFGMMGLYVPFVYLVDAATLVVSNCSKPLSLWPESDTVYHVSFDMINCVNFYITCGKQQNRRIVLTLILLMWRIWWAPNNASKWLMGFNSAFKGLKLIMKNCENNQQDATI